MLRHKHFYMKGRQAAPLMPETDTMKRSSINDIITEADEMMRSFVAKLNFLTKFFCKIRMA